MNPKNLNSLNNLSKKRIEFFNSNLSQKDWYKGSETYFEEIVLELKEAKDEVNTDKVYLEDELSDVLWDYLCLINSLKDEWKIDGLEKVIDRACNKYFWRINSLNWANNWDWEKIKNEQKKFLKEEVLAKN